METEKFTYMACDYMTSLANQGITICNKGKDPSRDCDGCEFMHDVECILTSVSTDR